MLQRRSQYRLARIKTRLETLEGYLIVFLNIDHVIAIIRQVDEPRDELIQQFALTKNQANAILDAASLVTSIGEMALRGERDKLVSEQDDLNSLLLDEKKQWLFISNQIREMKSTFIKVDKRKTELSQAPLIDFDPTEILVEREPITVICSANGWIRAMRGHQALTSISNIEGDSAGHLLHAETTDKILLFADNGRFYTLSGDKLPRGRGFGEPVSLMVDLPADSEIVKLVRADDRKLLVAASTGHGLVVDMQSALAQTRNGKQVLNVSGPSRAVACCVVDGDMVASVGVNRKLIIFGLDEVPELGRGTGVILQRFKDGGLPM